MYMQPSKSLCTGLYKSQVHRLFYAHEPPGDFTGNLTRDFRSQFFFMNQCPSGPQVFHWDRFELSKIRGDIRELMFITGANDTSEKLFSGVNDTGEKFIAGVISSCHGLSVIAGVVDTGDKFIVDTGDQLSAVTTTPAIIYRR
jgi:hypothetical protein